MERDVLENGTSRKQCWIRSLLDMRLELVSATQSPDTGNREISPMNSTKKVSEIYSDLM